MCKISSLGTLSMGPCFKMLFWFWVLWFAAWAYANFPWQHPSAPPPYVNGAAFALLHAVDGSAPALPPRPLPIVVYARELPILPRRLVDDHSGPEAAKQWHWMVC
jgi:hypothetical protein